MGLEARAPNPDRSVFSCEIVNPVRRLYRHSHRLRRFIRRRKDAITYHAARFALWLPRQVSLETRPARSRTASAT